MRLKGEHGVTRSWSVWGSSRGARGLPEPPEQVEVEAGILMGGADPGGQPIPVHELALRSAWDNLPLSQLVWLANSYSSCKTLLRMPSPTKVFPTTPAPRHKHVLWRTALPSHSGCGHTPTAGLSPWRPRWPRPPAAPFPVDMW